MGTRRAPRRAGLQVLEVRQPLAPALRRHERSVSSSKRSSQSCGSPRHVNAVGTFPSPMNKFSPGPQRRHHERDHALRHTAPPFVDLKTPMRPPA